jgi:hypothetical protein
MIGTPIAGGGVICREEMEVIAHESVGERWCFRERKRREFFYHVSAPVGGVLLRTQPLDPVRLLRRDRCRHVPRLLQRMGRLMPHTVVETYGIDCSCKDPEESAEYDALADLSYEEQKAHPLWPDFDAAMADFEDMHFEHDIGRCCRYLPMESCVECTEEEFGGEGDPDWGYLACKFPKSHPDHAVRKESVTA